MTYRDMAIKVCKICGQELINRAEELIPNTECIKNVDIWIRIPSAADDPMCVPSIEVSTDVYPKHETINQIMSSFIFEDD